MTNGNAITKHENVRAIPWCIVNLGLAIPGDSRQVFLWGRKNTLYNAFEIYIYRKQNKKGVTGYIKVIKEVKNCKRLRNIAIVP